MELFIYFSLFHSLRKEIKRNNFFVPKNNSNSTFLASCNVATLFFSLASIVLFPTSSFSISAFSPTITTLFFLILIHL
jgi:hypothetical protein